MFALSFMQMKEVKLRVEKLVANPNFLEKARPEVVEAEQERLSTVCEQIDRLQEIISQIA